MASRQKILLLILVIVFVAGSGKAYPGGIGGDANNQGDVSLAGCTCHASEPDNSVTIVLDGVPYHYLGNTEYEMKIQLIGGPDILNGGQTGGPAWRGFHNGSTRLRRVQASQAVWSQASQTSQLGRF